ncbi:hypothetical protein GCM10025864_43000 [Luteimicrobium album]|uniref:Uncharacterized protein n=1 Tax=Luteimicrobium album TaxID=1054550 RepID=A0ABQ6I762_9MICO|nr:hypothetical protein [Luteimicrobium album]GMA26541.1 hypothetical protein GCM10025864_43000 [Luteimicrobium album]
MSPLPADWVPHRRPDDREVLGWLRPDGDDWVAVSLLGRDLTGPLDWTAAEEALEDVGLTWLGDVWTLEQDGGGLLRVRLVEVTPERVVVQTDDFGAVDAVVERHVLPWPAPPRLRPRGAGDPDAHVLFAD